MCAEKCFALFLPAACAVRCARVLLSQLFTKQARAGQNAKNMATAWAEILPDITYQGEGKFPQIGEVFEVTEVIPRILGTPDSAGIPRESPGATEWYFDYEGLFGGDGGREHVVKWGLKGRRVGVGFPYPAADGQYKIVRFRANSSWRQPDYYCLVADDQVIQDLPASAEVLDYPVKVKEGYAFLPFAHIGEVPTITPHDTMSAGGLPIRGEEAVAYGRHPGHEFGFYTKSKFILNDRISIGAFGLK